MRREDRLRWDDIVMNFFDTEIDNPRFDYDDDEDAFLCKTLSDAYCIADFLKAIGFDVVHVCKAEKTYFGGFEYLVYPD